jgi:cell wall-associated NlpC family hydrolase
MNERIVQAAFGVLEGRVAVEQRPWFCLKVARQIVEAGMGWRAGEFYRRYWTHKVEENKTEVPWARDLERSLRWGGYSVHIPQAGDLVFSHVTARPYGHVGVMLTDKLVLENTPSERGFRKGNIAVVPLREWVPVTGVFRLRE